MPHPHIAHFDDLLIPVRSAGAMGYRLPAEWEPQSCVWVSPPANSGTWPRCLNKAGAQFEAWIEALRRFAPICTPHSLGIPTDDSWIRDYGPIFVVHNRPPDGPPSPAGGRGRSSEPVAHPRRTRHVLPPSPLRPLDVATPPLALHDFHFNSWGEKYAAQPRDDVLPQHIARWLGAPIWVHDFVLEGGAIESNGRGMLLTTEQCLMSPNRNPGWSRQRIEVMLSECFGVEQIIWLSGGLTGDDTDGHIDTVARFISPDTVLAVAAPETHPDHAMLQRNLAVLRAARDQDGELLNVIELPMPEPIGGKS